MNKEQVNVDLEKYTIICNKHGDIDHARREICMCVLKEMLRLKRLDKNVKRKIAEQNELKPFFNSKSDYEILYLLESLYDEITQES